MMSKRRLLLIPQDNGKPILLDYYDGAYGKTLRIDVQCSESLEAVCRFLEDFQKGATDEAGLSGIEQVVLVPPLVDVRLMKSGGTSIRASNRATGTVIEWGNDRDGWAQVIELLGPLRQHGREGKSGHQYLTPPSATILVELALLE